MMQAARMPTPRGLRALALAAALAVAALACFGPVQHASADGGNTITFTDPTPGNSNHISFTAATDSNQTALNTPAPDATLSAIPSPATISTSTADTGPATTATASSGGN